MRVDFVRRTPDDVDMAAIGFPARDAGGKVFVGVGDTAIVFFFEFVDGGVGIGIAAVENYFDELFALFVATEAVEGGAFFWPDDVDQVFVDDVLEAVAEFVLGFLELFFVLFFGLRFLRGRLGGRGFLSECIRAKQQDCGTCDSHKAHESPQGLDVGRERTRFVRSATRTARCTVRIRESVEGCPRGAPTARGIVPPTAAQPSRVDQML